MFRIDLKEYRERPDRLSDFLPWALMPRPSVVQHKDGVFQRTLRYRGRDLESVTDEELAAVAYRVNAALIALGGGWCVHSEASRRPAPPPARVPIGGALCALVDDVRRDTLGAQGALFRTDYFLTLTYVPPRRAAASKGAGALAGLLGGLFSGGDPEPEPSGEALADFMRATRALKGALAAELPEASWLEGGDLLTYLHSTVTDRPHPIREPEVPMYLDHVIGSAPLEAGLEMRLGQARVRVVSVKGWPTLTSPGMLDALDALAAPYRAVTRFMTLSAEEAGQAMGRYERLLFSKQSRIGSKGNLVDRSAVAAGDRIGDALEALGSDSIRMGLASTSVVVWDEDARACERRAEAVAAALGRRGLACVQERPGLFTSWLATLPGHYLAGQRRAMISTHNMAHLAPLQAAWAGDAVSTHLGRAPHVAAVTAGSTPFNLNLNVGDVGHTMILGPTGSGKSVLLGLLELQWMKYEGAQVFVFDKGRSSRAATLAAGGRFVELTADGRGAAFCPLARVDRTGDRQFAQAWLEGLLAGEGVAIGAPERARLSEALAAVAATPARLRTMSTLASQLQDARMVEGLRPYTRASPSGLGALWDNDADSLELSDWVAFEMGPLMEEAAPRHVALTLEYLFYRLGDRFDGRPTLLVLDEAWVFLSNSRFSARLKQWLKELRKYRVYVVFATQEIADALGSSIAPTLLQNCPTKLLLPNPLAESEAIRPHYRALDLNGQQIRLIARATPKRQYYYTSPKGDRLFELALSEFELALVGASRPADHRAIDAALARAEAEGRAFAPVYLEDRGFASLARSLPQSPTPGGTR